MADSSQGVLEQLTECLMRVAVVGVNADHVDVCVARPPRSSCCDAGALAVDVPQPHWVSALVCDLDPDPPPGLDIHMGRGAAVAPCLPLAVHLVRERQVQAAAELMDISAQAGQVPVPAAAGDVRDGDAARDQL